MSAIVKSPFKVDLRGQSALVTGASSGIGLEIAKQLAAAGANLVLVARRKDRLEALASELRAAHGVTVDVIASDLAQPLAAARLFEATEGAGRIVDIVVNNAGFGIQSEFLDIPWERTAQQLSLNIVSLTESCYHFGRAMASRGRGFILNVASIGAYLPTPQYATYAAGKSYVRNFSEAFAFEVAGKGVTVTCLCPGPTETEFTDVAGHAMEPWQQKFFMKADDCARIGLEALFARRPNVVAGFGNKAMMFGLRFLSRKSSTWLGAKTMASKNSGE